MLSTALYFLVPLRSRLLTATASHFCMGRAESGITTKIFPIMVNVLGAVYAVGPKA